MSKNGSFWQSKNPTTCPLLQHCREVLKSEAPLISHISHPPLQVTGEGLIGLAALTRGDGRCQEDGTGPLHRLGSSANHSILCSYFRERNNTKCVSNTADAIFYWKRKGNWVLVWLLSKCMQVNLVLSDWLKNVDENVCEIPGLHWLPVGLLPTFVISIKRFESMSQVLLWALVQGLLDVLLPLLVEQRYSAHPEPGIKP